jgi:3'-phosphoadenosine 5'-phosphosulfate sulfotransferase (PAPS reductase)/FAD synthetase
MQYDPTQQGARRYPWHSVAGGLDRTVSTFSECGNFIQQMPDKMQQAPFAFGWSYQAESIVLLHFCNKALVNLYIT